MKLSYALLLLPLVLACQPSTGFGQGTAFSYQGRLNDSANPANGSYNLAFELFDAPSAGHLIAGSVGTNYNITNGLFTAMLDFGPVFTGTNYWLQITVHPAAGGGAVNLSPRQPLTAVPYAIAAGTVTGPINGASIINGTVSTAQLAPGTVTAAVWTNQMAVGGSLYVNKSGSDSTGARNRLDLPFLTLTAAKTAASSGDTIFVHPGTYAESNLLKNGVNYHFYPGVLVSNTCASASGTGGWGIFDDRTVSGGTTNSITGHGNFYGSIGASANTNYFGMFVTTNPNTVIFFEGDDVTVNDTDGSNQQAGFQVDNCKYVSIRIKRLLDSYNGFYPSVAMGILWIYGETHFHADYISKFGSFGIWANEGPNTTLHQVPVIQQATNNMYISFDLCNASCYISESSTNIRTWWDFGDLDTPGGLALQIDSCGKHYFSGHKIGGFFDLQMSAATNAADLQVWLNVQKLSAYAKWMNLLAGSLWANVAEFEDAGAVGSGHGTGGNGAGIDVSTQVGTTADYKISGQSMKTFAGWPVYFNPGNAGTRLTLSGYLIDSSASASTNDRPVTVTAGGLRLQNCQLIAPTSAKTIWATSAQTVGIYGTVMANLPAANISFAPLGTFTVDARLP